MGVAYPCACSYQALLTLCGRCTFGDGQRQFCKVECFFGIDWKTLPGFCQQQVHKEVASEAPPGVEDSGEPFRWFDPAKLGKLPLGIGLCPLVLQAWGALVGTTAGFATGGPATGKPFLESGGTFGADLQQVPPDTHGEYLRRQVTPTDSIQELGF